MDLVMACDFAAMESSFGRTVELGKDRLTFQRVAPRERHERMARENAYDVCEYSLGNYLAALAAGEDLPFVALPLFFLRTFRHRDIWVSHASAVSTPAQLAGRRVGLDRWDNTAAVWQRGLLADAGLDLASVQWFVRAPAEAQSFEPPAWLKLTQLRGDARLDARLAEGELDAIMLPNPLEPGDAPFGRLFPDYPAAERAYYERYHVFPIMHVVVLQKRLLQEDGLRDRLAAFLADALESWVAGQKKANAPSVVWPDITWAEQEKIMGPNPWEPGLEPNRAALEKMIQYAEAQGVLQKSLTPDALFA